MSKYDILDAAIMKQVGGHPTPFNAIFADSAISAECQRINKDDGKDVDDCFRVLDRRLQALRRAGKIRHIFDGYSGTFSMVTVVRRVVVGSRQGVLTMAAKPKLTPGMRQTLENIAAGRSTWHGIGLEGRSAYGGHTRVVEALARRGYITRLLGAWSITDAGSAALGLPDKPEYPAGYMQGRGAA